MFEWHYKRSRIFWNPIFFKNDLHDITKSINFETSKNCNWTRSNLFHGAVYSWSRWAETFKLNCTVWPDSKSKTKTINALRIFNVSGSKMINLQLFKYRGRTNQSKMLFFMFSCWFIVQILTARGATCIHFFF